MNPGPAPTSLRTSHLGEAGGCSTCSGTTRRPRRRDLRRPVLRRHRRADRRQPGADLHLHADRQPGRQDVRVPHRRRSRRGSTDLVLSVDRPDGTNLGDDRHRLLARRSSSTTLTRPAPTRSRQRVRRRHRPLHRRRARRCRPSKVTHRLQRAALRRGRQLPGVPCGRPNTLSGRPQEVAGARRRLGRHPDGDLAGRHRHQVGATQLRNVLSGDLLLHRVRRPAVAGDLRSRARGRGDRRGGVRPVQVLPARSPTPRPAATCRSTSTPRASATASRRSAGRRRSLATDRGQHDVLRRRRPARPRHPSRTSAGPAPRRRTSRRSRRWSCRRPAGRSR